MQTHNTEIIVAFLVLTKSKAGSGDEIGPYVFGRVIFAVFGSQKRQLVFSESKQFARKFVDSSL